ncbi:MAG: roadblock/LC7 domain-containing protein [Nitrospiraceae bacterium]|jgi:predicted regulator of Ras-like GTPase activity (Roadblock/LC7/MglB family)|nr:MAG: roadblock/LC7 domain-containing protein [Nitrospiraceae bacterium]
MSFTEVLKETVDRVDGAVSSMIIASDGIPVQEYISEQLIDLTGLGAEASAMIRDISNAAENLGLGNAREFSIISERCGIIMRKINDEYYLALVIKPDGNYGKGRFILKTAVPKIEGEF